MEYIEGGDLNWCLKVRMVRVEKRLYEGRLVQVALIAVSFSLCCG